jgi:hypothetical protein
MREQTVTELGAFSIIPSADDDVERPNHIEPQKLSRKWTIDEPDGRGIIPGVSKFEGRGCT